MTRLMDKVIPAEYTVFVNLDDFLVEFDTFARHMEMLEVVAGHINGAGLT